MRRDAIKRAVEGRPPIGPVLEHYAIDFDPYKREQTILCPIHSEDHPSCSLNVDEGLWQCHACAAGGDVYTLVMMKENCGFQSARGAVERIIGGEPSARHGRAVRSSVAGGYAPRFRRAGSGQAVARRSWDGPPLPR